MDDRRILERGSQSENAPTFIEKWAQGEFDDCDYYALVAPLNAWSAAGPTGDLLAEKVNPAIVKEGWGIVTYRITIYVYSDLGLAKNRAKMLGNGTRPLKLSCLACFARAVSQDIPYVDMILDEQWHMESYVCRETNFSAVSHVRLDTEESLFQLNGCSGNGTLHWEQYPSYGQPGHPPEWCRPIAFPGHALFMDHTPQGGPVDLEIVSPPESLKYFYVENMVFGVDSVKAARSAELDFTKLYARPVGPLAFAPISPDTCRLTRGEGTWIPVAAGTGADDFTVYPWAAAYAHHTHVFFSGSRQRF